MIKSFYVRVLSGIVLPVLLSCGQQGKAASNGLADDTIAGGQEMEVRHQMAAAPQRQNDTLTLALVGDIMMGTIYPSMKLPANDGRNLFDDVKGLLRSADIAAGNLEGTVFDGPATTKKKGPNSYAFRTPAKYMDNLVDAGFDFVGVANNHASDFGEEGRQGTFRNLKDAGIAYAGRRGECEYAVVERNGLKVAFTQFGHNMGTLNLMNYDEVKRVVGEMRRNADIVVVSFHGGAEGRAFTHVPHKMETAFGENRGDVEKFAHMAIDAGADVVYGHGPHVPRAAELYKDKPVFYSLGNFCSPYEFSLKEVSGYAPVAVVKLDGNGRFLGGRIHSFKQTMGTGPRIDSGNAAAKLIRDLSRSDFPDSKLTIDETGELGVKF